MPAGVYRAMVVLRDLHDRLGQLEEISDTVQMLVRASQYDPRSSDDWDLLEQRDDRVRRLIQILRQRRAEFRRMETEPAEAVNLNSEMVDRFYAWADARQTHGAGSRPDVQARLMMYVGLTDWQRQIDNERGSSRGAAERLARIADWYRRQTELFQRLQRCCELMVRHWPSSAHRAKALAYMVDFETCGNLTRDLGNSVAQVQRRLGAWLGNLNASEAERNAWERWLNKTALSDRDVTRREPPRIP